MKRDLGESHILNKDLKNKVMFFKSAERAKTMNNIILGHYKDKKTWVFFPLKWASNSQESTFIEPFHTGNSQQGTTLKKEHFWILATEEKMQVKSKTSTCSLFHIQKIVVFYFISQGLYTFIKYFQMLWN